MNSPHVVFNDLLAHSEVVQAKINKAHISYDPFEIDNFKEAIQNMPDGEIRLYLLGCSIANDISQDTNIAYVLTGQARCHRVLMQHVKDYLKNAEIYNRHPSLDGDC